MDAHGGLVADFISVLVGQDAEADGVFVVGDLHAVLAGDGVLEAIGPLGPQDVGCPFLHANGHAAFAGGVGGDVVLFGFALADFAFDGGLLQHMQREFFGAGFAFGVGGGHGDFECLARHVHGADGADADRKALRRQVEVGGGLQVPLGQRHDQRQRLGFAELARRQLELELAFIVGGAGIAAAIGPLITHFAASQGSAVVEPGHDLAGDFFAAVKNLARSVNRNLHRFELILVDRERPFVALARFVGDLHAVVAHGAGLRQQEVAVEAAELVERDFLFAHLPAAGIVDFQRELLAFVDCIGIAAGAPHNAADMHDLPGAIGGAVGVEIALVGQALRHADAREIDDV